MNRLIELLANRGRQLELARLMVLLVLITMLAMPAADFTWRVVMLFAAKPRPAAGAPPSGPGLSTRPDPAGQAPGRKSVANLHLFGEAGREAVAPAADQLREVPKTTLNLVLKGVIAAVPMSKALAVINEKGGREEDGVYGVGDMVLGKAEVREIYADRIVLLRSGRLETLLLDETESGPGMMAAVGGATPKISSRGDDLHWDIDKNYLQQQLTDLPALAAQVAVDVYRGDNGQQGFRLISGRGSKLLTDLGLRPGDILYEVNGMKLDSAQNGLLAYQRLRESPQVTLKIGRGGQMMTRIYTIK